MGRNQTYKLITGHRGKTKGIQCQVKVAIEGHPCIICDKIMTRKLYSNGIFETWQRFYDRKTCSKECKIISQKGEGNPKWRGGLPRCIVCGERTKWYPNKARTGKNNNQLNPQKYCIGCYRKILSIRLSKEKQNEILDSNN